ncbi:ALKBH2 [Cervus elaphus hippelaphus]|uniref:DNA oxidative demethylase ALKBH2 n=1 Tax=Cervus elaphus hippelaphus TaxID=46360 RepID=A0A212D9Y1_CEREH|nr:ALKBH2 [Cervus elaphus hippelaphus]
MDRFLVKGAVGGLKRRMEQEQTGGGPAGLAEEEGNSKEKHRRAAPGNGVDLAGLSWRHIRAEGLDCDYTVLFGKAEADQIFQELEKEVEYFTAPAGAWVCGTASRLAHEDSGYKDGQDHIGEHRDDERELAPGSPIASVSFGACRDFFFRHKDSRGKHPSRRLAVVSLQLAHGSLLMMNHPTNTHWYHSLPVRKKVLAPRVNLTFRKILPTTK